MLHADGVPWYWTGDHADQVNWATDADGVPWYWTGDHADQVNWATVHVTCGWGAVVLDR